MKKLIVTVAALALSLGAFAQINFGVKVGGNLANISGMVGEDANSNVNFGGTQIFGTDASQSMKFGFNAGVFAEYMVMPMLGIQVEANFSTQGVNTAGSLEVLDNVTNRKVVYAANYVNVPILAKLHLGPIRVYAGPQLGFATGFNTKTTTVNSKTPDNEDISKAVVENYNSFDFSLALGAQYKLTENIGVDARYNIGLTNVFPAVKNDKGEVTADAWGKQGVVQLGVFYEF